MQCLGNVVEKKVPDELKEPGKAYHPKNEDKAKMLVFLAGLYETTTSIGLAAQKGY